MTTTSRRQWTDETIREALLPIATELGRMPRRNELTERGIGGLWSAMGRRGGVDAWREVVAAQLQSPVSDEDVRVAAYFLFENGHPGGADSHWFAAERAFATA
jgi:hypothetical protein